MRLYAICFGLELATELQKYHQKNKKRTIIDALYFMEDEIFLKIATHLMLNCIGGVIVIFQWDIVRIEAFIVVGFYIIVQ